MGEIYPRNFVNVVRIIKSAQNNGCSLTMRNRIIFKCPERIFIARSVMALVHIPSCISKGVQVLYMKLWGYGTISDDSLFSCFKK